MNDCVFCKIIAGEIPAKIYYRDDDVVVFADISPQTPVHALVAPRRHIEDVEALALEDAALVGRLILAAQQVARDLDVAPSGYRLIANSGRDSGQLVPHLHFHLLGGRPLSPHLG